MNEEVKDVGSSESVPATETQVAPAVESPVEGSSEVSAPAETTEAPAETVAEVPATESVETVADVESQIQEAEQAPETVVSSERNPEFRPTSKGVIKGEAAEAIRQAESHPAEAEPLPLTDDAA